MGMLLIAMINDNDHFPEYNPNKKYMTEGDEYGFEGLLNCNIWEWLMFICGAMIVGPILYLIPFSLPSWLFMPLLVFFSIILYELFKHWLKHIRIKWAKEDKQHRHRRSKKHKKKK